MEYVLALYDIRGKQEFIYRSNKIKEIMGGSYIIRDLFDDYLYKAANDLGMPVFHNTSKAFLVSDFLNHMNDGYYGELVYDGGGNLLILFKDKNVCEEITYQFNKDIFNQIGTLTVLCSYVGIDSFDNFKADRERLYAVHRENEHQIPKNVYYQSLPITAVERRTSLPALKRTKEDGELSKETIAKLKKYDSSCVKDSINNTELDKLVTRKGEESLLAVVYIDGNNMGAKVKKCLADLESYDACVSELRSFSCKIQKDYIDDRIKDINELLKDNDQERRLVIGAGDEINFICNARIALKCAITYLNHLPAGSSSCAGISIFHSHAPYSDAYRIAEECCETGKQLMKKKEMENACFIDFHYNQAAIDCSLDDIRDTEEVSISRPWLVNDVNADSDIITIHDVQRVEDFFSILGRSNIKGLLSASIEGEASLKMEITRMVAHMTAEKRNKNKEKISYIQENLSKYRNLIYDMVLMYDLWFKE